MQPVYVGDVAKAGARLLGGAGKEGATYELGGPAVKTMRELLEFTLATIQRHRALAPLPFGAASVLGSVTTRRSTSCTSKNTFRPNSSSPPIRSNC